MKILLTSFFNPFESSGSGLRSNSLLKNLIELGHSVDLFTFTHRNATDRPFVFPGIAKSFFVQHRRPSRIVGFLAFLTSILTLKPTDIVYYIKKPVVQSFVSFTRGQDYDLVIFDQLCSFELMKHLPKRKSLLYEHNVEYRMLHDFYRNLKNPYRKLVAFVNFFLVRSFEIKMLMWADCVVHISRDDLDAFSPAIREKSFVIPNTLPFKLGFKTKKNHGKAVLFVASMSHHANVEGIIRFMQEAWSDIHSLRPEVHLWIAGGNPPGEILNYNGRFNIDVLGYVHDLSVIYEKSSIAIAPINIGSGPRLKILEAMMHSTLNIVSVKGAEGLPVKNKREIVIAEDRQSWVHEILYYLDHEAERSAIEKNAHQFVENNYYYGSYQQVIAAALSSAQTRFS